MEVIDGNQANPSHQRRRSDKQHIDQRALGWFVREGDIALCPHSPLAIADVLTAEKGCFDLLTVERQSEADNKTVSAQTGKGQSADAAQNKNSLQQRRQRKHPRKRANLLTEHTQESLLKSCKQIQIENALVKRVGVRRLYLAAGFLSWPDKQSKENKHRAPVLLYPATLVRKIDTSDKADAPAANPVDSTPEEHIEYEVRLDSNEPEFNRQLLQWCEEHTNISLPQFKATMQLQDYFAHLAEAIADENMDLQFDIALGNCAPPSHTAASSELLVELPALPEHFDTSLAMAITGDKNLAELSSVLNLLRDYAEGDVDTDKLPNAANEAAGAVSTLHEYSKKLVTAGLGGVEFQHLAGLPENMATWNQRVTKALESNVLTDVLGSPELSARSLIRLAGAIELIDKAPLCIDQYRHADLAFAATPGHLQRAKHQASLIEDELSTLQNTFLLDKVPAKKQLLSLIEELGGSLDEGPDIIDADYFNARRQFMEFSIEKPTNLTPEHRAMLGKLAKVLRFRELFVNNIEYRLALGPGYRGLRTDWNALTEVVDYAQEIADVLENEALAAQVLNEWEAFRTTYVSELDLLQKAAESLRKLLWICGTEWQNKSVQTVIEHTKNTGVKLIAWNEIYGETGASRKTPANVLAQFSGRSHEDVLTEIHVGETQATINKHISGSGASAETVTETIEWLRLASQTASEHKLEITAIVEHLQIA